MDFMAEAAVFQHVSGHPHIIQFYGVCVDPGMCLITEFAVNGSLERLLVHSQRKVLAVHEDPCIRCVVVGSRATIFPAGCTH